MKKYKSKPCTLTIVIPVLNERKNIDGVLVDLFERYPDIRVIVVDDGSMDGTADLIRGLSCENKKITFLDRRKKEIKGLTISVQDAIEEVKTEYFIVMDGDGQHEANAVGEILHRLEKGNSICVASRANYSGWAWHRRSVSMFGSTLGKLSLFLRGKYVDVDILSGFFGAKANYWRGVARGKDRCFSAKGYKVLFDFLKIRTPGDSIANVEYVFQVRAHEFSKMGIKVILEYIKVIFR